MNKYFVTYDQALELKKMGFDGPCLGYYGSDEEFNYVNWEIFKDFPYLASNSEWKDLVGAPLKQQAFEFFREKFNLDHIVAYAGRGGEYSAFVNEYIYGNNGNSPSVFSYEESENQCIDRLIEIVKKGTK